MIESSLADGGDAGEQENTGIRVDLDNADSSKAVLRTRVKTAAPKKPSSWAEASNDKSADVKKRIQRIERRFNQTLADQEAAHQRQLAEMRKEFEGRFTKTDDTSTADESAHQKVMDKFEADLEEAQERGDSKAVAKITREMTQADNRFWAAQTAKKAAATTPTAATTTTTAAARPNGDGGGSKHTKAGVAWANANGSWWNDTSDDNANDARSYANNLHKRMLADGEDPEDADYFERIGEQVKKRFPEIDVKSPGKKSRARGEDDDDADGVDEDAPSVRHVAATRLPNRGEAPPNSRLATLTRQDLATMRSVGLNPDNNKHCIEFLRSKQEEAAES